MPRTIAAIAIALTCALTLFTVAPTAQDANPMGKTFLTFNNTVEVPGTTLQPGTYTFKLADTPGRNVVQVWDRAEERLISQWLFVPSNRIEPTTETVVMFKETTPGQTPAVHSWFYPGETIGKEFVYPREQALQIAQRTDQRVLSTDGPIESEPRVAAVDRTGTVTELPAQAAPSIAAQAEPRVPAIEAPQPPPAPTSAVQPAPAIEERPDALPQTASPMALIALIGALSAAGALATRLARR